MAKVSDNPNEAPLPNKLPPLLLTRPRKAANRFAELWRTRMGADAPIIIAPIVAICPVAHALAEGTPIFTSSHAITPDLGNGRQARAWCVGARTAEAASAQGYHPQNASGTSDDLVKQIIASGDHGPFVHYRGQESRGEVAQKLQNAGLNCAEIITYTQKGLPLEQEANDLLTKTGPILVPIFSPRSAQRLSEALRPLIIMADIQLAALSPAVAKSWSGPTPKALQIAENPNSTAMIAALEALITS